MADEMFTGIPEYDKILQKLDDEAAKWFGDKPWKDFGIKVAETVHENTLRTLSNYRGSHQIDAAFIRQME